MIVEKIVEHKMLLREKSIILLYSRENPVTFDIFLSSLLSVLIFFIIHIQF